jgi:hypothetical protein
MDMGDSDDECCGCSECSRKLTRGMIITQIEDELVDEDD